MLLSHMIAPGMSSVNSTIRFGRQLGRMCRNTILNRLTPMDRAASTNSFSFRDSVWARTTRAVPAQLMMDRAMNMLSSDAPSVYITTMANSSDGNASTTSARRMISSSATLPR